MSQQNDEHIPPVECLHLNQIEADEIVCTDCGKVLGAIFLASLTQPDHSYPLYQEEANTFMRDLCDRAHIPENIIDHAVPFRDVLRIQLWRQFKQHELDTFAVYEMLCRFKIPRSPQELASFAGIGAGVLGKIESSLLSVATKTEKRISHPYYEGRRTHNSLKMKTPKEFMNEDKKTTKFLRSQPHSFESIIQVTRGKSEDFVERFCTLLSIDFFHVSQIKTVLLNVTALGNIRPHCLAASVIYLYCKRHNLGPDMKTVCRFCGTSCVNVYKIVKDIRVCVNALMP